MITEAKIHLKFDNSFFRFTCFLFLLLNSSDLKGTMLSEKSPSQKVTYWLQLYTILKMPKLYTEKQVDARREGTGLEHREH